MVVSIYVEPPKPLPPPEKTVTISISYREAVMLTKVLGRCSKDDLRMLGVDVSTSILPAVDLAEAALFIRMFYDALRHAGVK